MCTTIPSVGVSGAPLRIAFSRMANGEEDKRVRIPLTETHYLQAKSSIEEYEATRDIDCRHPQGHKLGTAALRPRVRRSFGV